MLDARLLQFQSGVNKWLGLALWVFITFLVAWFGSQFQPGDWYAGLNKPSWTPPPWVFAPVWSVLYLSMAIAAWLVWVRRGLPGTKLALRLFVAQLALNALWSWIFFGLQQPGWAAIEIAILWVAIAMTVAAFAKVRVLAAILLVPYLLWVSYAVSLNLGIWRMN